MGFTPIVYPSTKGPWTLTEEIYNELCEDFPDMNVMSACLDARAWLRANEPKKKAIRRFLTNWLINARQYGQHIKFNVVTCPRFTGLDSEIREKERIWRRKNTLTKAQVDDMFLTQKANAARKRDTGNVVHISELLGESMQNG